jgi:predicted DNA-binding transcriptional regulator AlpA
MNEPNNFLGAADAAARAGLSVGHMYALRAAGKFPQPVSVGRLRADGRPTSVAWTTASIDEWRAGRPAGTAPQVLAASSEVFDDAPEHGGYIAIIPAFARAADSVMLARGLGARVWIRGARQFVVWFPSRGAERDARILATLQRQHPALRFEVRNADDGDEHLR